VFSLTTVKLAENCWIASTVAFSCKRETRREREKELLQRKGNQNRASLVKIDALNVVFWKSRTRGARLSESSKELQIDHGYASPARPTVEHLLFLCNWAARRGLFRLASC
jgi:hypothetical protein